MAHIDLRNEAPGILGLMAYKPITALALNQLAETILRGPSSLNQGERELIAGVVSYYNDCSFCHLSHAAVAEFCLDREYGYTAKVASDIEGSDVSSKMKGLLHIAKKVHEGGRAVSTEDIARAKSSGASDEEIHDTVLVAAAFCMFTRYVDGLGTFTPRPDDPYYVKAAIRLGEKGYLAPKPKE